MYDTVYVNLPYSITIGDKTLQPGDYVIQELQTENKSRVLDIYSNHGRTFEASAMAIAAYKVVTPENTSVVLHHFGNDYYFDKVWIQGKNYGYEFPLPNSVKQREKEALAPVTVAARYESAPAAPAQAAAQQPPEPAPQAAPEPQPEVAQTTPPPEVAQTTPPPQPAPQPEPEAQPQTQPEVAQAAPPAPAPEANRELPNTSADWLMMLLSGGTLSGAGLMLRRRG
jgi:hypothetical protein